jgi:hypothetical protein
MVHWELLARQSADTKQKDKAIYILNKKNNKKKNCSLFFKYIYPLGILIIYVVSGLSKKKKKHPATGIEKGIPTKLLYPKNNNWIVYVPRKSSPSLKGYWLRIIKVLKGMHGYNLLFIYTN